MSDCKHPTVIAGIKCLQCEIERLNKEIKELKERLAAIKELASAPKTAAEQLSPTESFIAQVAAYRAMMKRIKTEVQNG